MFVQLNPLLYNSRLIKKLMLWTLAFISNEAQPAYNTVRVYNNENDQDLLITP